MSDRRERKKVKKIIEKEIKLDEQVRSISSLVKDIRNNQNPSITGVNMDSRKVRPGNIFVAITGTAVDGRLFLSDAVEKGAAALIVEKEIPGYEGVATILVEDAREALALMVQSFYGNPSREMTVCGVTGTNGKTTTTYLLKSCLEFGDKKCGLVGTIEYDLAGVKREAVNTTPSPVLLAEMFADMKEREVESVVMEVSSHAIHQKRIDGIDFNVGVFTNLSQDHLDYHKTMENYREVKWRFFSDYIAAEEGVGVFNVDNETGRLFASRFSGKKITYGMESSADVYPEKCELCPDSTKLALNLCGEERWIDFHLPGRFNIMNVLAASAGALAAGVSPDGVVEGLSRIRSVPGRFELVRRGQPFTVVVDYAHTPDAIERVLAAAAEFTPGRIITVFGCGGDRDKEKRPIMASAVARSMLRNAEDFAILTSDNPRSEDPAVIASQAEKGLASFEECRDRYRVNLDRGEAIRDAVKMARKGDCVVITGKGHETHQKIGNRVIHFDDREEAAEALASLGYQIKE